MMPTSRVFVLFAICISFSIATLSVDRSWAVTLAELQETGVSNRKIIEKYELAVQQQEQGKRANQSFFWPQLDVAYNANLLDEEAPLENDHNSQLIGSLSYNVFSGFKDRNNLRASEQLISAKQFDLQNINQEIKFRIAIRYLEIFRARSRLAVARDEVALLQKQFRDAENRYNVGIIRKNDMLKLEVQLSDSIQKMETADANVLKSLNYLMFESGATVGRDELSFEEFVQLPEVMGFEYYLSILYENQSKINELEALIAAQSYTVDAVKSTYYPSVDLTASYRKYGDDFVFGLDENGEDEMRLQMDVNLNIFDGFKKQADISQARMEISRREKDLFELKEQLSTELKNFLKDLEVAQKNLQVAERSVSQAEENQRVSDVSFREGVESATDVLVAVLGLSQSKFNTIDARSQVFLKYYQLMRLLEKL